MSGMGMCEVCESREAVVTVPGRGLGLVGGQMVSGGLLLADATERSGELALCQRCALEEPAPKPSGLREGLVLMKGVYNDRKGG
jgi:hypothetical protein